jgi:RimJ/RimL family protein N-acetyltransferase
VQRVHLSRTNIFPIICLTQDQKNFISSDKRIVEALHDMNCAGYNVVADNKIVGFILLRRFDTDKVFLWNLLIDAGFQRQGIGKSSLRCLVEILKSEGMKTVTTTCSIHNTVSLAFFMNFGFSHYETVDIGNVHEMNLVMHL